MNFFKLLSEKILKTLSIMFLILSLLITPIEAKDSIPINFTVTPKWIPSTLVTKPLKDTADDLDKIPDLDKKVSIMIKLKYNPLDCNYPVIVNHYLTILGINKADFIYHDEFLGFEITTEYKNINYIKRLNGVDDIYLKDTFSNEKDEKDDVTAPVLSKKTTIKIENGHTFLSGEFTDESFIKNISLYSSKDNHPVFLEEYKYTDKNINNKDVKKFSIDVTQLDSSSIILCCVDAYDNEVNYCINNSSLYTFSNACSNDIDDNINNTYLEFNNKEIINNQLDIDLGKDFLLDCSLIMNDEVLDKPLNFYSLDSQIASIDTNGKITATGLGTTTIKIISLNNTVLYLNVNVYPKEPENIKIQYFNIDNNFYTGNKYFILCQPNFTDLQSSVFIFKSDNENIATIDNNGIITAVSPGNATITINSLSKKSKEVSFIITVLNDEEITEKETTNKSETTKKDSIKTTTVKQSTVKQTTTKKSTIKPTTVKYTTVKTTTIKQTTTSKSNVKQTTNKPTIDKLTTNKNTNKKTTTEPAYETVEKKQGGSYILNKDGSLSKIEEENSNINSKLENSSNKTNSNVIGNNESVKTKDNNNILLMIILMFLSVCLYILSSFIKISNKNNASN